MIDSDLKRSIINNPLLINDCLKDNTFDITLILCTKNEDIPNNVYLTKLDSGNTVLDELLKKGIISPFSNEELKRRVKENEDIIIPYINNAISFDLNILPPYILLKKINNKTYLDLIIENIENLNQDFSNNQLFIQFICDKFKNIMDIRRVIINNLKDNIDNWNSKYLIIFRSLLNEMTTDEVMSIFLINKNKILEYFDNNFKFKYAVIDRLDSSLVDRLIENFIEIFDDFNDEVLHKLDDNKIILDHLLDSEVFKESNQCRSLRDRLNNLSNEYLLVALVYLNHNILTDFQEDCREQFSNLTKLEFRDILDNTLYKLINDSEFYTNYFKPFLLKSKISKTFILYKSSKLNNKSILEIMISKDSKEEIKKFIIKNELEKDFEIVLLLKLNDIDIDSDIEFDILNVDNSNITKNKYESYLTGVLSIEEQTLINQFRIIFLDDNESNIKIIDLACNSFKYLFLNKFEYAKRDLQSLINIKIENPSFILKKANSSYFDQNGFIAIENPNSISSFNHEVTHLLHFYIRNLEVPEQFYKTKFEINTENYDRFIKLFKLEIESKKREILDNGYDYYSENKIAQRILISYEISFQKMIESAENNDSYSQEVIDYVRNHFIVKDEYKNYYNNYCARLFALNNLDDYYAAIIDIVDALCCGEIYELGIDIDNHNYYIGHGNKYFKSIEKKFAEILAQYGTIIKSHNKDEALMYLESIVGSELIKILDDYYRGLTYEIEDRKKLI